MVVQPTSEAFAVSNQMQGQLLAAIGLSLLVTVVARLAVGAIVHHAHLRAHGGDPGDRRRAHGRAGRHHRQRRDSPARRLVQLDGRSPRRAAGGRPEAGAAGDVRADRGRAGARPVAPDSEHRQQLQADREDVRRSRVSRDVQADGRARDGDDQARARRPAQHRAADSARAVPGRDQPLGRRGGRVDAAARRDRRPHAAGRAGAPSRRSSKGTCSRSAASTAT